MFYIHRTIGFGSKRGQPVGQWFFLASLLLVLFASGGGDLIEKTSAALALKPRPSSGADADIARAGARGGGGGGTGSGAASGVASSTGSAGAGGVSSCARTAMKAKMERNDLLGGWRNGEWAEVGVEKENAERWQRSDVEKEWGSPTMSLK